MEMTLTGGEMMTGERGRTPTVRTAIARAIETYPVSQSPTLALSTFIRQR